MLLLIALGLALTFGQMNVINMAHGEFIMAGAYTTYVLQKSISGAGVSLLVALPVAFLVAGAYGRAAGVRCSSAGSTPGRWTRCWSPGASR